MLKNKKMLAIIGGGAALVIILVVVLIIVLGGKDDPSPAIQSPVIPSETVTQSTPPTTTPTTSPTGGAQTEFDIHGYYYADGDEYGDNVYFYNDGSIDIYTAYNDETIEGYFRVQGDFIWIDVEVEGGEVTLVMAIEDDQTLVSDEGVYYYSVPRQSAAQPAAPAYDITGSFFYLAGDRDDDSMWFYSDGTMEVYYSDSDQTETWDYVIDGSTVRIYGELYGANSPYVLDITDEYTLVDSYNDEYIRGSESSSAASYWTLDPDKTFDSIAIVETLGLGMGYPTSELYVSEKYDDAIELSSMDNSAFFTIITLNQYPIVDGGYNVSDIVATKDSLLQSVRENTPGGIAVTDDKYLDSESMAYFKLTYNKDGETRYMCAVVKGWRNIRNDEHYFYAVVVDCLADQMNEYMELFTRFRNSRSDV
ncbi:MAG: hypothetical protein FWG48_06330 [Oscillospiraceae bacterium]|nr:hypothetical protein [Oscillospiraceae bacterium]